MKTYFYIFSFVGFVCACSEPYDFKIKLNVDAIVVDGLITDKPETYRIKIHKASDYGNTSYIPVQNANVSVSEDSGAEYIFLEDPGIPGDYISNISDFTGKPGHTYTLKIHTLDGYDYKSSPQLLLPIQRIDSVYGEKAFEYNVNIDASGNYISYKADGIAVFLDIRNNNDGNQNYRFMNSLYVQYTYQIPVMFSPFMYGWKKYTAAIPGDGMYLSNNAAGMSMNEIKKLNFTFIPFDKSFYNIQFLWQGVDITSMGRFTLLVKQYRMNEETSGYYTQIDKQMKAEGKLFDPITTQLNGNITCQTDPNKQAFGFFEASAKMSYVYTDESYNWVQYPVFRLREINLDNIPESGETAVSPPYFWIF